MRRVAVEAVHVIALVGRAQEVAMLFSVLVAGEAGGSDLIRGGALERNDLCRIAARLYVLPARPVAGFALPGYSCRIALVKGNLPMRRGGKVLVDFLVAILTAPGADKPRRQLGGRGLFFLGRCTRDEANHSNHEHEPAPKQEADAGHERCSDKISAKDGRLSADEHI